MQARTLRLARAEAGGALTIVLITIVVTVALSGVLLAVPNAALSKVRSARAKECSLASADAGVRDAIVWLTASGSTLTTGKVYTTGGGVVTAPGPAPAYLRFGEGGALNGKYAYTITPLVNGFFQIDCLGQALGATSKVRAVASKNLNAPPGAFTLANPTGSPWYQEAVGMPPGGGVPTLPIITLTQSAGLNTSPGVLNGADQAGATNPIPGAAFQNTNISFTPASAAAVQPGIANTTGNTPAFTMVSSLVAMVAAAPAGPGIQRIPVNETTPTLVVGGSGPNITPMNSSGIVHIVITNEFELENGPLIRINGNSAPFTGIIIIDIAPGVEFEAENGMPLIQTNGNPAAISGSVIVYQRGAVSLDDNQSQLKLMDRNGNAGNGIQWSSTAWNNALAPLPVPFKIASYVVVQ